VLAPQVPSDPASLKNLQDIVVPHAVPWWPPAPGWYGIGAIILAALAIAAFLAWRRRRADAYRRIALAELERLDLEAVPELVKRVALAVFPREQVASLSGAAWLEFLDRTGRMASFTGSPCSRLTSLAYDPEVVRSIDASQRDRILTCVRQWIRRHRAPGRGGRR
jgi:hypothetical protein